MIWWNRISGYWNDSTSRVVIYVKVLGLAALIGGLFIMLRGIWVDPQTEGDVDASGFVVALLLLSGLLALMAGRYADQLLQIAAEQDLSKVERYDDLKPARKLAAQAAFVLGLLLIASAFYEITGATAPSSAPAFVGGLIVSLVTVGFLDAFRDLWENLRSRKLTQETSQAECVAGEQEQVDPDQGSGEQQGPLEQGQADPEGQDEQGAEQERGQ